MQLLILRDFTFLCVQWKGERIKLSIILLKFYNRIALFFREQCSVTVVWKSTGSPKF